MAGLEPACLSTRDFKSLAYTISPHSHYSNLIYYTTKSNNSQLYWCSNVESNYEYYHTKIVLCHLTIRAFGTPCLIRTDSQLLLRESALPISVTGQIKQDSILFSFTVKFLICCCYPKLGATCRDRTYFLGASNRCYDHIS